MNRKKKVPSYRLPVIPSLHHPTRLVNQVSPQIANRGIPVTATVNKALPLETWDIVPTPSLRRHQHQGSKMIVNGGGSMLRLGLNSGSSTVIHPLGGQQSGIRYKTPQTSMMNVPVSALQSIEIPR